jgi:pimeloyl-ACP methyl ester carboxylesterase
VLGAPLLAALAVWVTPPSWGTWAAVLLCLATLVGWSSLALQLEKKFNMAWLLRSYAFTAKQAAGQAPQLDVRLEQHAETLLARIRSAVDEEVLIIGHSSGTMMAATVLANALRRDPQLGSRGPAVSLLTLGQWMPLLATLPKAERFRDDVRCLAGAKDINWVDFSAPPDGCCFALINPSLACGDDAAVVTDQPKLLSPKFADMFDANDYAAIRRDRFRCHFQYLMASKKAVLFDYFAITAGALTLGDRFRGNPSVTDYKDLRFF